MSQEAKAPPKPRRSRKRKLLLALLYVVYLSVILEIGCRTYWAVSNQVPFFRSGGILYRFYPHLRDSGVQDARLGPDDGHLDVLMLGGSALEAEYGTIEQHLKVRLAEAAGRPVRTFNLGRRGQTSRDSFFKYRLLGDRPFDLVLLYHGINDVRMNNCPRKMFRDDYTHASWYVKLERLWAHRELPVLTFPYTLEYTVIHVMENKRFEFYVPRHNPKPEWVAYGAEIKTDRPFRANFEAILRRARAKGEPVLLMTFANYVPPDYSLRRFVQKKLDYGSHASPIEVWGAPENVVAAIRAHNRVIKGLAGQYDHTIFVDQEALIPDGGEYFNDICHLTDKGCQLHVENLLGPVCAYLRKTGRLPPAQGGGPDLSPGQAATATAAK